MNVFVARPRPVDLRARASRPAARALRLLSVCLGVAAALPGAEPPAAPAAAVRNWKELPRQAVTIEGRAGFVVAPATPAAGRPWVWRTSFPGFHAEIDERLVARGYHVAYLDVLAMLGSDRALDLMDRFYAQVRADFGLAEKAALEAVSRGGLHAYRYAARHPGRIACLYADTPVMTLASWPLQAANARKQVQEAMEHYGFKSEDELRAFRGNPLDLLAPIARAKIPLRHVISLNDTVVPPEANTLEARRRLRALGWDIDLVTVAEGTAASQGHHFPLPQAEESAAFIMRHTGAGGKIAKRIG